MIKKFNFPNIEEEKTVLKTIRLKVSTLNKIEELSQKTNVSMNRLFNECIKFALNNMENKK